MMNMSINRFTGSSRTDRKPYIAIHRGAHQIGGVVTEVSDGIIKNALPKKV
jgi:hypothetical protein